MKVKELVEKLKQCSQDAIVCVEAFMDADVNDVKEYLIDNIPYVYIGDDLEELEYNLGLHD